MAESIAPADALVEASRIAGGDSALARIAGVTPGAVWQRIRGKKPAAEKWVLKIEEATGVSRHDLRPDIYPRELAAPAPLAELPDADMAAAR